MMSSLIGHLLTSGQFEPGCIALKLHISGTDLLIEDLPENCDVTAWDASEAYVVTSNQLKFQSLSARNQVVAKHLFKALLLTENGRYSEKVYEIAHELWRKEISRPDKAAGRFIEEVSSIRDVLKLAADEIRAGSEAFDALHVIEAYLQYASHLNIASLIDLARAQHEGTKKDLMGSLLYGALDKWLAHRPAVARDLLNQTLEVADDVTANLVNVALIGLSGSNPDEAAKLTIQLLSSQNTFVQRVARWSLGAQLRLNKMSIKQQQEAEQLILLGLRSDSSDVLFDSIRAATGVLHLSSVFDDALHEMAQAANKEALVLIANTLFLKDSELSAQGRFYCWLPTLLALGPTEKDHLNGLDHVLKKRLGGQPDDERHVLHFLTAWIKRHGDTSPINSSFAVTFDSCLFELAGRPALLSRVMTQWLLDDSRLLAAAVAGTFSELDARGLSAIQIDIDIANNLAPMDLKFLIVRMLGFVHGSNQLISMTTSLLRMKEEAMERALPLLKWLVVEEVGYDYPGSTSQALEAMLGSELRPFVQDVIRQWRTEIDAGQNLLEQLPRLNEFRSPTQLRRQLALARNKQMNKSREEASERFIWKKIATQIPIKAGRGFFNHSRGEYSNATDMQTFSYSVELPRREVLDPVGYAYRGFRLRNARRGE